METRARRRSSLKGECPQGNCPAPAANTVNVAKQDAKAKSDAECLLVGPNSVCNGNYGQPNTTCETTERENGVVDCTLTVKVSYAGQCT